MKNYICIDGKKAELTEEQLIALGIEVKKEESPFDRVGRGERYYCISGTGNVMQTYDLSEINDTNCYAVGNYCTDYEIMKQRSLHEALDRLLWRYSMKHDGDKIDWNDGGYWNYIYYSFENKEWYVGSDDDWTSCVYFYTDDIAKSAIEAVIKPFMKAHPEFDVTK